MWRRMMIYVHVLVFLVGTNEPKSRSCIDTGVELPLTSSRDLTDLYRPIYMGAKGDWDMRISDLVKNPDGTDI